MDRIILLQRIVDKKMTQLEAAEEIGLSERQVRRLVKLYITKGSSGFVSKAKKTSNRSLSANVKEQVLGLIQSKYIDFGPTLISEKLEELELLKISRETLRKWMIEAGLWKGRKRKKARIHQSRERRSRFGELVQIDGSPHDWFEGRSAKCCLIVMIDDATSKIVAARFEESETTFGYMRCAEMHLKRYGRPVAYYSDKHSIFKTRRESAKDGIYEDTQFHRALKELNIKLICANSPQAKGRVERANQTLQDRLIKDMRLDGISDIESGNAYLKGFLQKYNKKFGVKATDPVDAHRKLEKKDKDLELILSIKESRKISKNLEFSYNGTKYQILNAGKGYRMRQGEVLICNDIRGEMKVLYESKELACRVLQQNIEPIIADSKDISLVMDNLAKLNELSTNPQSTSISA